MNFDDYQREALKTRQRPAMDSSQHLIVSLLGISGEAGELISEYKKYLRDGESYAPLKERAGEELGDLLWYVASVADEFGLSLNAVAQGNLKKIEDRWTNPVSQEVVYFDKDVPEGERLPRRLTVSFTTTEVKGIKKTQMRVEGSDFGDALADNAYEEDGYRFHDVFHWACAAMLGWSPVVRKLLQRKRKSDSKTDEVEDGSRAAAIEEGISALVFSYATDRGFLNNIKKVDSDLLRTIKGMTRHLEVQSCSPGDWERTILATFRAWSFLNSNDGGTIIVNLPEKTIKIDNKSHQL